MGCRTLLLEIYEILLCWTFILVISFVARDRAYDQNYFAWPSQHRRRNADCVLFGPKILVEFEKRTTPPEQLRTTGGACLAVRISVCCVVP